MSLINTRLYFPQLSGHNTQSSIIAGKTRPRAERNRDPDNDMNRPRCGIATAMITEMENLFYNSLKERSHVFTYMLLKRFQFLLQTPTITSFLNFQIFELNYFSKLFQLVHSTVTHMKRKYKERKDIL